MQQGKEISTNWPGQRYVADTEASDITGLKTSTLRKWRVLGKGPRYRRLGRRVVYGLDDLRSWIEACPMGGSSLPESK
jgi:hypothetical protein